ncbi:uncharacterized protein SCHCODRAFT_02622611 [Schizophyllum commune H4-8]|uniref:uncharacterized protein n=1 Tax=Schizophyllum commune (strain H4-8 / FGSC 9210) TaxID=578458 RepID=UPI00215E3D64|nr:uncharacterized protein SCHCODRAFT_02622611 [Schizophyllum commune H4-8]KAI5893733.1 hypothetical protein SCHCODRAFT_02622611 [Schizophyllum commune H4-8]
MAQPVSRDDFFYDGTTFYVEIEGKHRHPRCDASSLHGLLTYTPGPLLTKKGQVAKRQPPPHKDPPAHFYTAQMIHYGLKPLKTRDPAKKRLVAAFNGGATLAVPAHILQLEQQLATEFAVSGKAVEGPPKTKAKAKAKGAKQAGLAVTFVEQEQPKDVPQVARGSKAARKPAPVVDGPALRSSLEGLAHRDLVQIIMRIADDPDVYRTVFEHVRKLQAAVTPLPSLDSGPPRTKAPSGQHARKSSQSQQKPSELFPPLEVSSDLDELTDGMDDTPPRVSRNKNRAGQTGASAKAQSSSGAAPLMGVYDVSVPYLEEQWPDSFGYERHALLKVRPSSTGAHLWGSFDFGPVTGFFKSYGAAPTSVGSKSELRWRGRDEGSGEMQLFEEEQIGYVKFLADGRIQGRIEGSFFGKADFTGELKEANISVKDVQEWKDEWRSMNESSYEAARVGRWGGWGGDPEPDKPDASDTEEEEEGSEDDHYDSDGSANEGYLGVLST